MSMKNPKLRLIFKHVFSTEDGAKEGETIQTCVVEIPKEALKEIVDWEKASYSKGKTINPAWLPFVDGGEWLLEGCDDDPATN